jgi:hypothetical protein
VEKTFKKAISLDRARIQLSHISKFGILELSRQKKQSTIQEISYTPCPFCLGTGWSDQADSPDEIRRAVYLRQAAHVERDTLRLAAVGDEASLTAGQVPADGRRELAAWLIRLQSRLVRLVSADAADADDQAARFGSVVARIETLLKALRPQLQTGEPSPEELPPGA